MYTIKSNLKGLFVISVVSSAVVFCHMIINIRPFSVCLFFTRWHHQQLLCQIHRCKWWAHKSKIITISPWIIEGDVTQTANRRVSIRCLCCIKVRWENWDKRYVQVKTEVFTWFHFDIKPNLHSPFCVSHCVKSDHRETPLTASVAPSRRGGVEFNSYKPNKSNSHE